MYWQAGDFTSIFKPNNKSLSLLTACFRIIYVAILGAALLNLVNILLYISGAEYLKGFGNELLQSQVLFSLKAFYAAWSFGLIVFGIHILLVGYLILKSGYAPKILGILLLLAFFGYTITTISNLLFHQYKSIMKIAEQIFMIPMLGEVALGIWLLFKGFKFKS